MITAIASRMIHTLSSDSSEDAKRFSDILEEMLILCCFSKMQCSPEECKNQWDSACNFLAGKEWTFSFSNVGGSLVFNIIAENDLEELGLN
jgi:hypothetical protein